MKLVTCGACAITLAAIGATGAAADDTTSDMKCLLAFAQGAGVSDPAAKATAQMGVIYYLGRLDGRTPGLDLTGQAVQVAKTLSDADIQAQIASCGAALTARGQALNAMGTALGAQGKAPGP